MWFRTFFKKVFIIASLLCLTLGPIKPVQAGGPIKPALIGLFCGAFGCAFVSIGVSNEIQRYHDHSQPRGFIVIGAGSLWCAASVASFYDCYRQLFPNAIQANAADPAPAETEAYDVESAKGKDIVEVHCSDEHPSVEACVQNWIQSSESIAPPAATIPDPRLP